MKNCNMKGCFCSQKSEFCGLRKLTDLQIGMKAYVHSIDRNDSVGMRLLEIGLVPGTPIELIRIAPSGNPLEIRLRGYSLSIRREECECVNLRG